MKRLLIIGLALSALFAAAPAFAQTSDNTNPYLPAGTQTTIQPLTSSQLAPVNLTGELNSGTPQVTQNPGGSYSVSGTGAQPAPPGNGTGGGLVDGDPDKAFGWLLGGIMSIFAWLAGTAGILLNDAVYYTVVSMGKVVNPNNLSAIGVAWRILRDLGNIVLIFGFIAIGISTIIGYNSYGISKRLPTLLIVAIFINFSLFATEAIIDVGNLFATQIYTQINNGQAVQTQSVLDTSAINGGISGTVMNSLALQTFYNVSSQTNHSGPIGGLTALTDPKIMLAGVLGSVLFLILAFVLFSLAFILIARFVVLVLLMIVAPIGFAGLIVPGLEGTAQSWWKMLFDQTVTGPALLLILYVALAIITDSKFLQGFGAAGGNYTAIASGATGAGDLTGYAGLLLSFLVAMGLLMATVITAKKMGAVGASAATKWAGAASFGAVGFIGRRTAGRYSNYLSQRMRSGEGWLGRAGQTELGRLALKGTDLGAKATFDIRGAKVVQDLAKEQHVDLGATQKGGYSAIEKAAIKERTEHAKLLEGNRTEEQSKLVNEADKKQAAAQKASEERNRTQQAFDTATADKAQKQLALDDLTKQRGAIVDADLEKEISTAEEDLKKSGQALASATDSLANSEKTLAAAQQASAEAEKATDSDGKSVEEIRKTTVTKKGAQKKYAESLQKNATIGGTILNSIGFGGAVGAAHAIPVAIAGASLGTVGAVGASVGGLGALTYRLSAARKANQKAYTAVMKDVNKDENKKFREAVLKAAENAEKDENEGAKKEEKEEESH